MDKQRFKPVNTKNDTQLYQEIRELCRENIELVEELDRLKEENARLKAEMELLQTKPNKS